MKIGNIEIKNTIFLAPMAGVTDVGFRKICKDFGAGLTYTEMASTKGFLYKNKKTEELLTTFDGETPVAAQLFGSSPDVFRKVCKSPLLDKFDIIDINMGCPAPKIVKNGDGSALLKNMSLASEIIKACVESTTKPITVKFRIGFGLNENIAVEFAKMCEASGASAICVHGRTREQFYSGKADLETIKKVKESVNIPVIGNGDVCDKESYQRMLDTGVDAVMIGRGCLGKPEIFSVLQNKPITKSKFEIIQEHMALLKKYNRVLPDFKKHLLWYISGYRGCNEVKIKLMNAQFDELEDILKEFFTNQNV